MSLWNDDSNIMLVAGHRGARVNMPENTLTAFSYAAQVGCDMIETDIRQTKDHQLVLMHDATVERTTDGSGLVRDMTLSDFRKLNAAAHAEGFAPEKPPLLEELFEMLSDYPSMLLNLELKDYPTVEGEEWAYETADKTIALMEKYGLGQRCVFNSFNGQLLGYIDKKYNRSYPLHGYYPYFFLGENRSEPEEYLACACLFHCGKDENGKTIGLGGQVCPKEWHDYLIGKSIEPWVGAGVKTYDDLKTSFEFGARLVTTDNPAETLGFLRAMGHHR